MANAGLLIQNAIESLYRNIYEFGNRSTNFAVDIVLLLTLSLQSFFFYSLALINKGFVVSVSLRIQKIDEDHISIPEVSTCRNISTTTHKKSFLYIKIDLSSPTETNESPESFHSIPVT